MAGGPIPVDAFCEHFFSDHQMLSQTRRQAARSNRRRRVWVHVPVAGVPSGGLVCRDWK